MTLLTATLIVASLLLLSGLALGFCRTATLQGLTTMARSSLATVLLFGGAAVWFLWIVAHLGEADFGEYRQYLFVFFLAIAILAFYFVPDFLAIRGLAALMLLAARPLLDAAFLQEPTSRLFLVTFVYVMIIVALILGTIPYKFRDIVETLTAHPLYAKLFAGVLGLYGLVLLVATASY